MVVSIIVVLVISTVKIIDDNHNNPTSDVTFTRRKLLDKGVNETTIDETIEIELSDLSTVILTLEGRNVTNQTLEITEDWLREKGVDYTLKLFRQMDIKLKQIKQFVIYWFAIFLIALLNLIIFLFYVEWKDYKNRKKYLNIENEIENENETVNLKNLRNNERKQIK